MKIKDILAGVLAVLTLNFIGYLAFAFMALEWNPFHWGVFMRCGQSLIFIWSMGQFLGYLARIKRNG